MESEIKPRRKHTVRSNQCLFCLSSYCSYAIYTSDLNFVEIACRSHHKELERHADTELNGRNRHHLISSQRVSRIEIREQMTKSILELVSMVTDPNCEMTSNEVGEEFLTLRVKL